MAFQDEDRRIDPEAYYSERDLVLRWGIGYVTQSNEIQGGRLKAVQRKDAIVYRGADLLAWLNPPQKQEAPKSPPTKTTGPTRSELSQIEPGRIYSGSELVMLCGLDLTDQSEGRKNGSLRCAEPGTDPRFARYLGADVLGWVNTFSSAPPVTAAASTAPELRSALPSIFPPAAAPALASQVKGTSQMPQQQAKQTFEMLIEAEMKKGFSRIKATSRVVAAHPDLHAALLREANGGRDPVHCLPR